MANALYQYHPRFDGGGIVISSDHCNPLAARVAAHVCRQAVSRVSETFSRGTGLERSHTSVLY